MFIEWVERPYILCSYLDAAQMYKSFFTWDLPLRWSWDPGVAGGVSGRSPRWVRSRWVLVADC